jgi:hypothetical protein
MKIFKKVSISLLFILVAYILLASIFFGISIGESEKQRRIFAEWQEGHIVELAESYDNETAIKIDEQSICGFNIQEAIAEQIQINQLRYLCTHNSYKQGLHNPAKFFYNYIIPYAIGKKSNYGYDNITQQLNIGIRGFEFDLYYAENEDEYRFECYHNSWLETNSSVVDFEKGLEEIKMWSEYNPNHMPIFITIEPKDNVPLDKAKGLGKVELETLDDLILEYFPDKVITYSQMLNGFGDFQEMREANGYIKLEDCIGKFVFLLHEYENFEEYIDIPAENRVMIPLVWASSLKENKYLDLTCFAQDHDYNHPEKLDPLIEENYIVRTRLDIYPKYEFETTEARLDTGAQLVCTDYPPSYEHIYKEYTRTISENGYTIILLN